jgi:lipopolysaccharide biosynthesis glycosyltransferase
MVPTGTMIYSAVYNAQADTHLIFHLIDSGLDDDDKNRISRMVSRTGGGHKVLWYRADSNRLQGLPERDALPRETYLRLMVADLLPTEVSRLIWLDSDMVIERDLSLLWKTDLGSCSTGAVPEYGAARLADVAGTAQTHRQLHLDGNAPYFNAGLMLIDLAAWRAQHVPRGVFSYIEKFHEAIRFGDQDGLNTVLCGKWKSLDRRWNVQMSALRLWARQEPERRPTWYIEEAPELNNRPWIIHFTDSKPWESAMFSRFRSRYYRYLWLSGMLPAVDYGRYRMLTTLRSAQALFRSRLRRLQSQGATG